MADYHIYLHGVEENGGNKTTPFSSDKESAFKPKQNELLLEDENISETGASALSKIVPITAIAVMTAKTTDHILSIGFSHLTEYTGHYEYEMGYNNFKTMINHALNPVGYLKQILHRNFQFKKENIRVAEEAKIIGRTIYDEVKIGV